MKYLELFLQKNFENFHVDKDVTKDSQNFQLTSISGNIPALKDKKIHDLSLT